VKSGTRPTIDADGLYYLDTLFDWFRAEWPPSQFAAIFHMLFQCGGIFMQRPDIGGIREIDTSPKSSEFISDSLPMSSQQSPSEVGVRRFHPYRALSEQE
jgi:hypothetical protein